MRIVVIGGTGLVGAMVADDLRDLGHDVVRASPRTGVDTLTGNGLERALAGAHIVVDVSKPHTYDAAAVLDFFATATTNLLAAERRAAVGHHVVLAAVGTDRPHDIPFYRAKAVGEELVRSSGVPFSVVQATQFFEFARTIADVSTHGDTVRVPSALVQPMAARDVARLVAQTAVGVPLGGDIEIAGPERFALADFVGHVLRARGDSRSVIEAADATYFGGHIDEGTLLPAAPAWVSAMTLSEWLSSHG
jgi:uncharacterized protein YbjT (DUF2867 family)